MTNYSLSKQYPQKRAFITGAASGLGKALCLELAKDAWTLGICDLNGEKLDETAQEIKKSGGTSISYILNVADKIHYQQVAEDFLMKSKGIDVLFNNAGVGDGGEIGEYALENWEWMVSINQMAVIYGCHFFVPIMKKQKSGHIINTASIAAIAAMPKMGSYNVTKAAVLALSETLYTELYEFGIKVSCVMPSFFKTNIIQYARGSAETKVLANKMVNESPITAETIAKQVLKQAGKGKLHIVLIRDAKFLYWFKRYFPMKALKAVIKLYKKQQKALKL